MTAFNSPPVHPDWVPGPDFTNDPQQPRSQQYAAGVAWNNRLLLDALRDLTTATTATSYARAYKRARELLTELDL